MNALLDYGVSSDDSDEIDGNETQENINLKLPKPDFEASTSVHSVFSNPFTEAEQKEKALLEKHVKMVPTNSQLNMINGKKICWNYRKGRCRFGHNCMFAHDSDLQQNEDSSDSLVLKQISTSQPLIMVASEVEEQVQEHDVWEENISKSKHKRPGLSQSIVPGKKVINAYKKQRLAEKDH